MSSLLLIKKRISRIITIQMSARPFDVPSSYNKAMQLEVYVNWFVYYASEKFAIFTSDAIIVLRSQTTF